MQDMTENFSVETETAKTVKEMRARDPAFDMIKFLRALKQDVKPVIQVRVPLWYFTVPMQHARCWCLVFNAWHSISCRSNFHCSPQYSLDS